MGTLYLDRRGARLDFDRGAMVIREPDAQPRSVPLSLLDRLVVVGDAQLSAGLLTHLAENGTSVTIMPGRRPRRSTFLHGQGHGDVARRIGQYRIATDRNLQTRWAQRIVWLRLAGQRRLLNTALHKRPDLRHPLITGLRELQAAMHAVRAPEATLENLRGREGAATAAFFRGYRSLFADSLGFERRNRRPPRDPVNAALSLAYTLTHGDALRAITASGLEPMVGVLHEPTYGRDSLACDLAEIARARVERLIWRLFAKQALAENSFVRSRQAVLLGKPGRETFFRAYEGTAAIHRRWLFRIAQAFARECSQLSGINGSPGDDADVPW